MTLRDFLKNHSNLPTTQTNAILYPYRPLKDNLNIKSPSSRTDPARVVSTVKRRKTAETIGLCKDRALR